ncbi:CDP-alcohol phosphatidyltransferase family protein [Methylocella sp.]|uniref:CDP-alcohol phosphatidyltransferase family protein n=1 Tax=Methylocella sp. TaxID=1978226 RepID=UPI00378470B9
MTQSIDIESFKSEEAARPTVRVQGNVLARAERALLDFLCARMPAFVTPDRLTALAGVGAGVVFLGYALARFDPAFFWLANLGFVIHWFGDSLDGSLARFRRVERPRYGYVLDHGSDALCNLVILGGLGLSPYVRLDVALFVLIGYYLLCMYVFLYNHASGRFQLSFLALGPTELRLGLIAINVWMFSAGPETMRVLGQSFSIYDLTFCVIGSVFVALFVVNLAAAARRLRAEDDAVLRARAASRAPAQRPSTKLSTSAK